MTKMRLNSHLLSFLLLFAVCLGRKDGDYKLPVPQYGNGTLTGSDLYAAVWSSVMEKQYEHSSYDGWYNNRANPEWGSADMPMLRQLPTAYADGVFKLSGRNRPNPLDISEAVMNGSTGLPSLRKRTVLNAFFGDQVMDEIANTRRRGCPPEYFNIKVPKGHPKYDITGNGDSVMPFARSRYDQAKSGFSPNSPRDQLNEITPFIDGGLIYGPRKTWSSTLRSGHGGRLLSTTDDPEDSKKYLGKDFPAVNKKGLPMENPPPPSDHFLQDVKRFFALGNQRGNENPFLLTLGVFWYRFHNHVADRVSKLLWNAHIDPIIRVRFNITMYHDEKEFAKYHDEKIFNEARKWVIATHQKIIFYDWLPSWLGTYTNGTVFKLPHYKKYNPHVSPQVTHVFEATAMKFGQTLIPSGVRGRKRMSSGTLTCDKATNAYSTFKNDTGKEAVRLCNNFWKPIEPVEEFDIDEVILGMSSQVAEQEDAIITEDLRGYSYGDLEFSRRDLMADHIKRGRDHGLPDYNTARKELGLPIVKKWTDINPNCDTDEKLKGEGCEMIQGLKRVYNDKLDDLDIWPAGISETTGDGPGELFRMIIAEQFTRIRDGDRFWFENDVNELFSKEQMNAVNSTSLRDIILEVTSIDKDELAGDPFFLLTGEEKCGRLLGRAASDGYNITDLIDCNSNFTCQNIADALRSISPTITDTLLKRYADCENGKLFETDPCPFEPVNATDSKQVSQCTNLKRYDYFTGSEASYVGTFTFIGAFIILMVIVLVVCARSNQNRISEQRRQGRAVSKRKTADSGLHSVSEWQGHTEGERNVKVKADFSKKSLLIFTNRNYKRPTRAICCKKADKMYLKESADKGRNFLLIRIPNEYDLVLKFDSVREKTLFTEHIKEFCATIAITPRSVMMSQKELLKEAVTKARRQETLDKFFRIIFRHAFRIDEGFVDTLPDDEARAVINCELSVDEFADALSLKSNSMFVKNMFELIDKDKNGLVSFREFLDMIVIFAKGDGAEKAKLLFDMYDVQGRGELTKDDFRTMLRSLMELANTSIDDSQIDQVIVSMFEEAGLADREKLMFDDFSRLLRDYKDQLDHANLSFQGMEPKKQALMPGNTNSLARTNTVLNAKRENAPERARRTVLTAYGDGASAEQAGKSKRHTHVKIKTQPKQAPSQTQSALRTAFTPFANYMENYRLHIFWVTLYTLVALAIFAERAYYYSIEREHVGLRRVAGYGITITRGSASGLMFAYSTLLLTMCRNLITVLRETFFNRIIPFDSVIWFHKYVAYLALTFTVVHVVGHAINFYHISTQSPLDLACLFRNFSRAGHILPKFSYWCWNTITGVTGVLLALTIIVMFVFAQQYARRNLFRAFWLTHQLFYIVFILMILHGAGILVQPPMLWTFLIGPLVIFVLDKLISLSRNKTEISITKAELLPSDVTGLTFKRPAGFEYRSGQWVRIACLDLGENEYHPFTLTSSPHEDHLSLHIRAVGPWTMNIRSACDPKLLLDTNETDTVTNRPYPKLYLDGPFGEGHQDWYKYEVAVLVGGGIGVTPFASILKDIVHKAALGAKFNCKKVYFLWVTRSQKQFEWLVDIIKDVEAKDPNDFVSVHIFITQFFQKFDLRTTMLYICERHFQKVSNKSLFTGLRSITHFGRPDFSTFLGSLNEEHPGVSKIGVFSCGPAPMTKNVEDACSDLNKSRIHGEAAFIHHYENF